MGQNDDGSGGSHDPLPEGDDEGSGVDVRQTPFEDHQPGSSVDGQAQAGEAPSGHQESAHFPPWTAIGEQPSLVGVAPDVEGGPATVLRGMVGPGIRRRRSRRPAVFLKGGVTVIDTEPSFINPALLFGEFIGRPVTADLFT